MASFLLTTFCLNRILPGFRRNSLAAVCMLWWTCTVFITVTWREETTSLPEVTQLVPMRKLSCDVRVTLLTSLR